MDGLLRWCLRERENKKKKELHMKEFIDKRRARGEVNMA
jgi:hypothetical protein